MLNSRDDKIRTCDHTPPRRVLYRAELHPVFLWIAVQRYVFMGILQIFFLFFCINNEFFSFDMRNLLFCSWLSAAVMLIVVCICLYTVYFNILGKF